MELTNIIIIVILIFIIYYIVKNGLSVRENMVSDSNKSLYISEPFENKKNSSTSIDDITNSFPKVNEFFEEKQFHNDYRDTINALNQMIPNKKYQFNQCEAPVRFELLKSSDVKPISKKFLAELNRVVKNSIKDSYAGKNWQDAMPQQQTKEYKSGWDKHMNQLGLPGSIYNDPVKRSSLDLVCVDHVEKYTTEDETKFVIFLILQKRGICDQIIIKLSIVADNKDINLDRDFFKKGSDTYDSKIVVEELFVVGFMTRKNFGKQSVKENWYNFKGLGDDKEFTHKQIIKKLIKKKKDLAKSYNDL